MEDIIPYHPNVSSRISPRKSKYADDVEFWRARTDFYQTLIDIQIAIISLQNWCSKWQISINILKTTYMLFYNQRKMCNVPPIPLTINGVSLNKVSSQRILGIIIENNPPFSTHIKIFQTNVRKHITD